MGNIAKTIKDHLKTLIVLPNSFLINTLLHNMRHVYHTLYTYSARARVRAHLRSKHTA
jgi:hypothetical protein